MATFKRVGTIHSFGTKFVEGMVARGYERDFAQRCFDQIKGFGDYAFRKAMPRASPTWFTPRPG
jgi:error-prone DNA polymerase